MDVEFGSMQIREIIPTILRSDSRSFNYSLAIHEILNTVQERTSSYSTQRKRK